MSLRRPGREVLGVPTICEDFLAQISDGYPFDRWAIRTIYSNNLSGNYLMKYEVVCSENSTSASDSYFRTYISGSWKSWQRFDNFGCSTAADLASLLGVRKWTRNTLNPNESLVISHTSDYAPIFIRELAKEGAGALILPEYNPGSYAILKTPKFDQVLSLEKTAQYTIIVTNISNTTTALDYLALV